MIVLCSKHLRVPTICKLQPNYKVFSALVRTQDLTAVIQQRKMSSVEYNYLGSSGLRVSNICLGTMTFGEHPTGRPFSDEAQSHKILDKYVQMGGNFIDTADMYQNGASEKIIGSWLAKQNRHKLVVATKFGKNKQEGDLNSLGNSRHHMMTSVEESLRRLGTDYIDLFYSHVFDYGTPLEETLQGFDDLVASGKVRYVAVSNMKGWQLQKAVEISKQRNWRPIVALQQQYSLLVRSPEWEVTEVCANEGVGLLPWSPLKGGWLSGKVHKGVTTAEPGSRMEWAAGRAHHSHPDWAWFADNQQVWKVLEEVEDIAKSKGKTMAQVSIRWLLQKPYVPSVVIGGRTVEQIVDNIGAGAGWELSAEEIERLDKVSALQNPYPYDYIIKDNLTRYRPEQVYKH